MEMNVENQSNRKQRMFANPFSFKGRIGRLEFFLSVVIGCAISVFLRNCDFRIPFAIPFLVIFWFGLAQNVKRFHDRERSGWYWLTYLIPIYNLLVAINQLIEEGTVGPNNFGQDPISRK